MGIEFQALRRGGGVGFVRGVLVALCLWMLGGAAVHAQFVERNLPPGAPAQGPALRVNPDLLRSDDQTPLGGNLRAIVLVGAKDKIANTRDAGVQIRTAVIDADAIRARLLPFLGQAVTRKLITDIQSAIAGVYRDAGRPFVSITIPPQEITGGALRIRVVEGRLDKVSVRGAVTTPESFIRDRVRIVPGEPIDARKLEADLDWLNRNPFRRVEAVFGPGKELAQTELTLQATESKPWQVFAGYANSGTRLTDRDRYFVGAVAALPGDVIASYQITGSKDFYVNDGRAFSAPTTAQYFSPAGRLIVPLWFRSSLEIAADTVQTNERPADPFRIRTRTSEVSALYRTAVSNLFAPGIGDWIAGFELRRQDRRTYFAEVDAANGRAEIAQIVVGWAGRWSDPLGTSNFDARFKLNPGGVLPNNTSAAWNAYTNGRVSNIQTTFAMLQYDHRAPLMFGMTLLTEVTALLSSQALPDTERLGLGGIQTVRGYVTEDGVVDRALVVRNTLYLPSFSIGQVLRQTAIPDTVTPFLLADFGSGRDVFLQRNTDLASFGAGFDDQISTVLRSNFTVAYAARSGAYTNAGTWRIQARLTASY